MCQVPSSILFLNLFCAHRSRYRRSACFSLQSLAVFRPSHGSHTCGPCEGRNTAACHRPTRRPGEAWRNPSARTLLLGGFLGQLGSPQQPSIRAGPFAASHSLLHSPEGDPGKPGQEPTHLTLGFYRKTRTGYGGSYQVDAFKASRLQGCHGAIRIDEFDLLFRLTTLQLSRRFQAPKHQTAQTSDREASVLRRR